MAPEPRALIEAQAAFLELVEPLAGECWAWHGSLAGGAAVFRLDGETLPAPLASWLLFVAYPNGLARLEPELELERSCSNRVCTNPVHLSAGVTSAGVLAAVNAQHRREVGAMLETCRRGHPRTLWGSRDACLSCARHSNRSPVPPSHRPRRST